MRERIYRLGGMLSQAGVFATSRHIKRAISCRWQNCRRTQVPSKYAPQWKAIAAGRYDEAISVLSAESLDAEGFFVLGGAYHARGSMSAAVSAWTRGMEVQAKAIRSAS